MMCWAAVISSLLLVHVAIALPTCSSPRVELPATGQMIFAVVGDWGRVGAQDSLFNPYTVQMCETTGMCCSDLQEPQLAANFDYSDVIDGPQQVLAATLLDEVCGSAGCQFVLGMGDNFYPCGADSTSGSGLNRFQSDWESIYHTSATPNIQNLTWYHVFGNHDYGFNFSVNEQLDYGSSDDRWVTPSPYYSRTFAAGNVTMKVEFLDETPFVATKNYISKGGAYNTDFLVSKQNPAYINSDASAYLNSTTGICSVPPADASFLTSTSSNATGQVPWLQSCLTNSSAMWNTIVGHYALYGSDTEYAQPSTPASKVAYPGNCGGFGSVANMMAQYGVDAYFNGHDHTQTHADPAQAGELMGAEPASEGYGNITYLVSANDHPTQYFTLGNGGSIQYADGVTLGAPKTYNNFSNVVYNQNVQYSASTLSADAATGNAAVGEGFAIVEVKECTMVVRFYNIENYDVAASTAPAHTAIINKCGPASTEEAST